MNSFEDPQIILEILKQMESSVQEDISTWKVEMAGEFAHSYLKIREEQLETIKRLHEMWLWLVTKKFN